MDERQFYWLYINTNCIAELALRQIASQIAASTTAAAAMDKSPSFDDLDLSMLDGLDYLVAKQQADVESDLLSHAFAPASVPNTPDAFDIERYLANAYQVNPALQVRVAEHYQKLDGQALNAEIAAMPVALPYIATQLSGQQLQQWIDAYRAGDQSIVDLVARVRQLDL